MMHAEDNWNFAGEREDKASEAGGFLCGFEIFGGCEVGYFG